MIDEIIVGLKDAVGEPVVAEKLADVFDWIEFGVFFSGGRAMMVMLGGTTRRVDKYKPA